MAKATAEMVFDAGSWKHIGECVLPAFLRAGEAPALRLAGEKQVQRLIFRHRFYLLSEVLSGPDLLECLLKHKRILLNQGRLADDSPFPAPFLPGCSKRGKGRRIC